MKNTERMMRKTIEGLRNNLHEMLSNLECTDENILSTSQKLDKMIVEYIKINKYN